MNLDIGTLMPTAKEFQSGLHNPGVSDGNVYNSHVFCNTIGWAAWCAVNHTLSDYVVH